MFRVGPHISTFESSQGTIESSAVTSDAAIDHTTAAGKLMRDFFREWRRTAGCAALMLACLLTGAWVISLRGGGIMHLPLHTRIVNQNHFLLAGRVNQSTSITWSILFFEEELNVEDQPNVVAIGSYEIRPVIAIPFITLIVPLMFLSAWLLLSNPRVAKEVIVVDN